MFYVPSIFLWVIVMAGILATNNVAVFALYGILDVIYVANYCAKECYAECIKDMLDC